jgi:hypothetical protein
VIARFSEAVRLLWNHLGLFAAIILTVWLPGNALINYVVFEQGGLDEADPLLIMKISMWIEGIVGPIYIGALLYALLQIKSGRRVSYGEAIGIGVSKWGSLFAARFIAGVWIALGFLALVIPGVVLMVRYSLLDSAVVIEGKRTSESRARSVELTAGRRWQIFWSAVLFFVQFVILSVVIYAPLGFVEQLDSLPVAIALDCVLSVAYAVIQIVFFLFYWEASRSRGFAEPLAAENGDPTGIGGHSVTDGSL